MKKYLYILLIFGVFVIIAELIFPSDKGPTKFPSITTKAVETTTEETINDSKEPEYISEFMLIAGEQGEYGKLVTYNAGTEFEESFYAYYVPAGTYSVTNKGTYATQINVYSNETHFTEEGWEEPVKTHFVKQIGVAETITVIIGEDQHIEIHKPTELRMRLISTDVPETTVEPETTPEPVTTAPPVVTTTTSATTAPAPEVPAFQTQTAYIGNFVVTLTNATVYTNAEGNHILVADYQFTNNSEEADAMAWAIMDTTFQNGIELDKATAFDLPDYADYDSSNFFKNVKDGATLDVQVAYLLNDNVNIVEIELSEFFDLSGAAPQVFTITLNP